MGVESAGAIGDNERRRAERGSQAGARARVKRSTGFLTLICGLAILAVAAADASAGSDRKPRAGPAPFDYFRCAGEAVPDWPFDVRGAPDGRLDWTFLGARPITDEFWSGDTDASGRVASIAVHPTNPNVAYAATASGGLWKTTDGGANWTPLTDTLSNLNSGWVTLDPGDPEIVYLGTGEYATGASGDGLFRSADGGATWTRIATTAQVGTSVSRIVVHPTNPSILHVSGRSGVTRSIDGGTNWSSLQLSNVSDLVIDANNPSTLYCGRRNVGLYKSTNDGQTWTALTTGLPAASVGRINMGIARSNPQVLYAGFVNINNGGLLGFYKTSDGGANWTQKTNTPNYPSPQGSYDHFVAVDPTDENVVYAGGVFPSYAPAGVIRTTDGGDSWIDITISKFGGQVHPDQHCMAFGPDGTIWVGNDGGVWKSPDPGAYWINCNATLAVTQNYQIALHPTDPHRLMGGTQDNGTHGRFADVLAWPQIIGGDGGFLAYDYEDPAWTYTTYVRLAIFRFFNGGYNATITGPWSGVDPAGFIAPLVMDPNDPRILLGGTNRVWRTLNARAGTVTWTALSGNLAGSGVLNAIAVARGDSNVIYVGSTTGIIHVTTDAATWEDRTIIGNVSSVADIVIDPADAGHAFLSLFATSGGRVYETTDYGVNWTARGLGLPGGLSARALAVDWRTDPPRLFVGTGVAVYASYNGGATWIKDSLNLPNVNIGDLAIDRMNNSLTAGTYGRGAWRTPLPCVPGDLDADDAVTPDDVPPFVAALLASTLSAEDRCGADVNEDGIVDGRDVEKMVDRLIP